MLKKYLEQDINNPTFLFHGSPKKLDKLVPMQAHDSNNNENNVATAVFLFPSFLKATPYAFKDTIKASSEGMPWSFDIPNNDTYPLMSMSGVKVDESIVGYVYVFKRDDRMIKDEESYQYKCFSELVPVDVVEVRYSDFSSYYEIIDSKNNIK